MCLLRETSAQRGTILPEEEERPLRRVISVLPWVGGLCAELFPFHCWSTVPASQLFPFHCWSVPQVLLPSLPVSLLVLSSRLFSRFTVGRHFCTVNTRFTVGRHPGPWPPDPVNVDKVENPARTNLPVQECQESENLPSWPLQKHLRNKPRPYRKQGCNDQETRYRKDLCTRAAGI